MLFTLCNLFYSDPISKRTLLHVSHWRCPATVHLFTLIRNTYFNKSRTWGCRYLLRKPHCVTSTEHIWNYGSTYTRLHCIFQTHPLCLMAQSYSCFEYSFFFFSFLFFPRMYVYLKRFPFLILIAYKQLCSALPFQNWSCLQKISFTTRNLWGLGALYSSHIELSPAFFFNWITLIMGCYETLRLFFHFRIRKQVPLPT